MLTTGKLIVTEMKGLGEDIVSNHMFIENAESEMLRSVARDVMKRDQKIYDDLNKQVYRNVETNERVTGETFYNDFMHTNNLVNELGDAISEYEAQLDGDYPTRNPKLIKELNERYNVNHRILKNMERAEFEKVFKR